MRGNNIYKNIIKKLITVKFFCLIPISIMFFACSEPEEHIHSYKTSWEFDNESHWHPSACGHTGFIDKKESHSFESLGVTTPLSGYTDGEITYICHTCGMTKTTLIHRYDSAWESDDNYHWHKAFCEHKEEISEKLLHNWEITEIIEPVTLEQDGKIRIRCKDCDIEREEIISKPKLYINPIDSETKLNATQNSKLILFGVFPQSILPKDTDIRVYEEIPIEIGPFTYYPASDGEFYEKFKICSYPSAIMYFSDGTEIKLKEERFFKLEPIKWRVLTNNYESNGLKYSLLFSENLITMSGGLVSMSGGLFSHGSVTFYENNYKYSGIRSYLNGKFEPDDMYEDEYKDIIKNKGFLQKAFTPSAIDMIQNTIVNNSIESAYNIMMMGGVLPPDEFICPDTTDKIFLLSVSEAAAYLDYDFPLKIPLKNSTDYAWANSGDVYLAGNAAGKIFSLRSPVKVRDDDHTNRIAVVGDYYGVLWHSSYGIAPALCLDLSD